MKNVVISILIFVLMVVAMIISLKYLNKVSSDLKSINNDMESYISSDKWKEATKTSEEYERKWENYSKNIKLFVNHQELDNIETELSKLPQYVKEKTKDEALASVHVLEFLIDHISSLEKINIQNIF